MKLKLTLLVLWLLPWTAGAHVGSPNVFFEGKAGPYPVRVIVRPPGVVPGLAEISIRVEGDNVQRVAALPVFWNAGRKGAPPPDEAALVRGETNLYTTALWLMKPGAYSVDVAVEGARGSGRVVVPVNSTAITQRPMATWFGAMLIALGLALFVSAVMIAGAAFGEATLEPTLVPGKADQWRSLFSMVIAALVFFLFLAGGKAWWDREDAAYRNNRLYKPFPASATVRREGAQNILRLTVENSNHQRPGWTPLIPDHGKMMHLFLIREPGLDAFAHIHPVQRNRQTFDVPLPPLPSGTYRAYADVTQENGFAQTLVTTVQVPEPGASMTTPSQPAAANLFLAHDPDDSWHVDAPGRSESAAPSSPHRATSALVDGCSMVWEKDGALLENREASLRFKVLDATGHPAMIQPYMGMLGHAAVQRDDGTVFTHLHPGGSISMASQEFFTQGAPADCSRPLPAQATDKGVSFPYEFPKPGHYRIWVQVKSRDRVMTGVFDTEVMAAKK